MEHPWFLKSCLFKVVTKDGEINDEKAEGYVGYKLSTELCNRLLLRAPHLPDYITSAPNGTLSDKAGCQEVILGLLAWGPVGAPLWRSGIPHVNLFVASLLRERKKPNNTSLAIHTA
jgi:hypothetical protein